MRYTQYSLSSFSKFGRSIFDTQILQMEGTKPNDVMLYDPYTHKSFSTKEYGLESAIIADPRTPVQNIHEFPYNCCGLLLMYFEGCCEPFMGTGFLISDKLVCTAAHNVYNRLYRQEAQHIKFFPALKGKTNKLVEAELKKPYKYCPAFPLVLPEHMSSYDYALLRLVEPIKRPKYFTVASEKQFTSGQLNEVSICGYPGDKVEDQSFSLFRSSGKCSFFSGKSKGEVGYEISTSAGMSGSPIYYKKDQQCRVVAVHHGKIRGETLKIGGCVLNREAKDRINSWIVEYDASSKLALIERYNSIKYEELLEPSIFDETSAGFQEFSIEDGVVTYRGKSVESQLFAKTTIKEKRNCTIAIIETEDSAVCFGIIDSSYSTSPSISNEDAKRPNIINYDGWGGVRGEGKGEIKKRGKGFDKGDKVRLQVKIEEGKIEWFVNDEAQAKLKSELLKDRSINWVPYIEMCDHGDKIKWLG